MKVVLAQINPIIGAIFDNCRKIIDAIKQAKKNSVDLIIFPEMSLSGYPPQDLLLLPHFMREIESELLKIIQESQDIIVIVGLPRINESKNGKSLYNSAAIIEKGHLLGYQDKSLLPTYDVFDERRYFEPSNSTKIWSLTGKNIAVTICEDIWQGKALDDPYYGKNPILELSESKPDLLINLSASPFSLNKLEQRLKVCKRAAVILDCPVYYCNQVGGNDSLIFDGYSFMMSKDGQIKKLAKGFQEDFLLIDTDNLKGFININYLPEKEIYNALVLGVKDYFLKSGFKKACLGLSGGIDSAIVACVAADALGPDNVIAVAMPSRYSSDHSFTDARELAKTLKISLKEISIEEPFTSYLNLLSTHFEGLKPDVTEENLQARIRGALLMAFSNKFGCIVLSTGNKSEMAMGYCTLYGDMCGGLAVIGDVTKGQVYAISKWLNREKKIIPENIIHKAPSAELRPNQKDQDTLPEYEVVDNVLQAYVEKHLSPEEISEKFNYSLEVVKELIKRIHQNEYKRRQAAPVLRVSEKAFTVGRFFPIVENFFK